jgi:alkyl hydroperoxide reductase subunit AhpC
MKTLLQVSTQGITGGKTKTERKGWAMLSFKQKEYSPMAQISVDTFEGSGNTYKERDSALITISFHDGEQSTWSGNIDELKEILSNINKLHND